MKTRTIAANDVRIPELNPDEVLVIERYGKPHAAIIDAETFELFERVLGVFGTHRPVELSLTDAALAVHQASERGHDIEEFDFSTLGGSTLA